MQTWQDGEDRLLTLQHLLVEYLVCLVELCQTWCAVNNCNGINILKLMFTVVDGNTQLLSCSCSEDVDGVGNGRAREQLAFQLVSFRTFYLGDVQSTLR